MRITSFIIAGALFVSFLLPRGFATTPSNVSSIDQCLKHKLFTYNDEFDIWVNDDSLVRCVRVGGVLRAQVGTYAGGKDFGQNPVAACRGKQQNEILEHGQIQRDTQGNTSNSRVWAEKCSAIESLPGRNALYERGSEVDFSGGPLFGFGGNTGLESVYGGGGLGVPDRNRYDLRGISEEKDLKTLIIGWTNFLLPYVSILSVFAFVAAGLFYIVSFFSEDLNAKAKNILLYTIIGIVLIFSAYTIVSTLLSISEL